MSAGEKDDLAFWELLSHEVALERDDDGAPDANLREKVRARALKEIARGRRETLSEESLRGTRPASSSGRYDDLSKAELWTLVTGRMSGSELAVQHRDFEHASEQDLRSMLEDADELERPDEDSG